MTQQTSSETLDQLCERFPAVKALREENERLNNWRNWWCPDVCPITGLPFFMWITHHETDQWVPTYGGPYDSYTIPVRDENGCYIRECYDHDLGGWRVDEHEDVGVQIVNDQLYTSEEDPEKLKAQIKSLTELSDARLAWGQRLESQLAELRQGGEAVGKVIAQGLRNTEGLYHTILYANQVMSINEKLYTRPQPAIQPGYAVVKSGWVQMVVNALRRDADEGKVSRGEMVDALENAMLAAAPSVPVAEKALPENVKLLLLKAHRQLETEYRQQTRATEAKHVANGTCGESPGGASSIALLAESGYISSIGKRNQEVRDEIFAMLAAPADSKEGE